MSKRDAFSYKSQSAKALASVGERVSPYRSSTPCRSFLREYARKNLARSCGATLTRASPLRQSTNTEGSIRQLADRPAEMKSDTKQRKHVFLRFSEERHTRLSQFLSRVRHPSHLKVCLDVGSVHTRNARVVGFCRHISTPRLNASRHFHLAPINVVISHESQRFLILESASRLDAFSGYPFPT